MTAIADGRPQGRDGTARALPTSAGRNGIAQLTADMAQWDRAAEALSRKDYEAYDAITGFKMKDLSK